MKHWNCNGTLKEVCFSELEKEDALSLFKTYFENEIVSKSKSYATPSDIDSNSADKGIKI